MRAVVDRARGKGIIGWLGIIQQVSGSTTGRLVEEGTTSAIMKMLKMRLILCEPLLCDSRGSGVERCRIPGSGRCLGNLARERFPKVLPGMSSGLSPLWLLDLLLEPPFPAFSWILHVRLTVGTPFRCLVSGTHGESRGSWSNPGDGVRGRVEGDADVPQVRYGSPRSFQELMRSECAWEVTSKEAFFGRRRGS